MTTDQTNGRPAHMRDTGAFPTEPLLAALRKAELERRRGATPPAPPVGHPAGPVSPHLLVDGSKTNYWPVQDPNPTGAFNALRPHVPHPQPNVVIEEPKQDRLTLRSAAIYLAVLLALVVVVAVAGVAVTR